MKVLTHVMKEGRAPSVEHVTLVYLSLHLHLTVFLLTFVTVCMLVLHSTFLLHSLTVVYYSCLEASNKQSPTFLRKQCKMCCLSAAKPAIHAKRKDQGKTKGVCLSKMEWLAQTQVKTFPMSLEWNLAEENWTEREVR